MSQAAAMGLHDTTMLCGSHYLTCLMGGSSQGWSMQLLLLLLIYYIWACGVLRVGDAGLGTESRPVSAGDCFDAVLAAGVCGCWGCVGWCLRVASVTERLHWICLDTMGCAAILLWRAVNKCLQPFSLVAFRKSRGWVWLAQAKAGVTCDDVPVCSW